MMIIKKIKEYYHRRKLLNRYKKIKFNPALYGTISDVMAVQPLTAPVSGSIFHIEYVYGSKNVNANEVLKNIDRLLEIIEEDKNGKIC